MGSELASSLKRRGLNRFPRSTDIYGASRGRGLWKNKNDQNNLTNLWLLSSLSFLNFCFLISRSEKMHLRLMCPSRKWQPSFVESPLYARQHAEYETWTLGNWQIFENSCGFCHVVTQYSCRCQSFPAECYPLSPPWLEPCFWDRTEKTVVFKVGTLRLKKKRFIYYLYLSWFPKYESAWW